MPDDHADEAARWLSCESCGERFAGIDVGAQKRWAPAAPPPPVDLVGVPVSVDVLQPGDGTIEFRIAHFSRRGHGPLLFVWFLWLVGFGVGAVTGLRVDRYGLAATCGALAVLGVVNIQRIGALASRFTHLRWDRVSGALAVWSTGESPVRVRFDANQRLTIEPGARGFDLATAGEPRRVLAIDVPLRATEWVVTTLRTLAARGSALAP